MKKNIFSGMQLAAALVLCAALLAFFACNKEKPSHQKPKSEAAKTQVKETAKNIKPAIPSMEDMLGIISPNQGEKLQGNSYSFVTYESGVNQIYISNGGKKKILTDFADGMSNYFVSRDRSKALIQAAPIGNEQWDIYLLDFKTGKVTDVLKNPKLRYDDPIWRPDGGGFLYSVNDPSPEDFYIYYYDFKTGKSSLEVKAKGNNSPIAFSSDGKYFTWGVYRAINDSDGFVKELGKKGNGKPVFKSKGNTRFSPVGFISNEKLFVVTNEGEEFSYPAIVSLKDLKIKPVEKRKWPLEGAAISDSGSVYAYIYNMDGASELTIIDSSRPESRKSFK